LQNLRVASLPVLQLDAHLESSLAAIRSLGKRGIQVAAGSHRSTAMGLYSRYAAGTFLYPSPLDDQSGFVKAIVEQTNRMGRCILLSFSDSTLLPLVRCRHQFQDRLIFVLPSSREDFEAAFDKARTLKLAERIGVEIPVTSDCAEIEDISALACTLSYPAVVKPRKSVSWNSGFGTHRTSVFVFSADELVTHCAEVKSERGKYPLIQEYVRGEEVGAEFLCRNGQVLAACAHRRIRSVSPVGGRGAVTETIPLAYHGIGERAEQLVAELRWTGPIMVEFKIDRDNGIPKLMETNGRFWGSLPLAIASGVDFPYLYYRLASSEAVKPARAYRQGVVSRNLVGDSKNLFSVLFVKSRMRSIKYPSRARAIKEYVFPPSPRTPAVLDLRDIKPSFAQALYVIGSSLKNQWSRRRASAEASTARGSRRFHWLR
jgi:predicted ATP-grasp superfamily ATP-dependent carboligase